MTLSRALPFMALLISCGGSTALPARCSYLDPLDDRYVACTGTFFVNGASLLCPPGYGIPIQSLPPNLLGACESFRGGKSFFAADVPVSNDPFNPTNNFTCGVNNRWKAGLMGCGGSFNATAKPGCGGFPVELMCWNTTTWQCGDSLDNTANMDPNGGVICYKR